MCFPTWNNFQTTRNATKFFKPFDVIPSLFFANQRSGRKVYNSCYTYCYPKSAENRTKSKFPLDHNSLNFIESRKSIFKECLDVRTCNFFQLLLSGMSLIEKTLNSAANLTLSLSSRYSENLSTEIAFSPSAFRQFIVRSFCGERSGLTLLSSRGMEMWSKTRKIMRKKLRTVWNAHTRMKRPRKRNKIKSNLEVIELLMIFTSHFEWKGRNRSMTTADAYEAIFRGFFVGTIIYRSAAIWRQLTTVELSQPSSSLIYLLIAFKTTRKRFLFDTFPFVADDKSRQKRFCDYWSLKR